MSGQRPMDRTFGIRVFLHLTVGALIALMSILADYILQKTPDWGVVQSLVLASGIAIAAMGLLPDMGIITRVSMNACLGLLSVLVLLGVSELCFRVVDFDFSKEERNWRKIPPYYRHPVVPTGNVFFRRTGPEQWTGQVLNTVMQNLNAAPNPYTDEPAITVTYNTLGFRNSEDLTDWDIAVAGDSFTELGYLPYDQLFTTILGNLLNMKVLNLGTSYTGPLTQLSYLEDYGISASTKHAAIIFFEGNDLKDLEEEYEALAVWQESGQRDYREFKTNPSILRALYKKVRHLESLLTPNNYVGGYFKSSTGLIPVSLSCTPPGRSDLSEKTLQQLNYFFGEYAEFGRRNEITLWLAYMPCIRRVLHGQIEFLNGASPRQRNWQPTDLPQIIAELSGQFGIRFIDLTPALLKENRNQLVFNPVYDTHVNARGSVVVAQEMARHFKDYNGHRPKNRLRPTP